VPRGPDHVHHVLRGSPEPFAPANVEKRAAFERFQPHGVLVTRGEERAERRRFNEVVLDTSRPVHSLGGEITAKVAQEGGRAARRVPPSRHARLGALRAGVVAHGEARGAGRYRA
jgi:hypothetical protein